MSRQLEGSPWFAPDSRVGTAKLMPTVCMGETKNTQQKPYAGSEDIEFQKGVGRGN